MDYDILIIGSGPGGYVTAIRAAQLGNKVGVVEKENLGGICLNWGCIPTKSLLKSAQVYEYARHAADYGVSVAGEVKPDFEAMVKRSRGVAEGMSKGIQYLIRNQKADGSWDEAYFTGTGFPKHFFIRYHNYRNCFPLMALGQYLRGLKG